MLKRSLPLALACFALISNLYAQKFDAKKIRFSVKAGINFSQLTDDVGVFDKKGPGYSGSPYSYYEKYVRISGQGGVAADYPVTPKFSLGAELLYTGRGGGYRVENNNVAIVYNNGNTESGYDYFNFKIDYIELPLLAQYSLAKPNANTSFIIYGGVAPGIAVNTGVSYTYYVPGNSPTSVDTKTTTGNLSNVSTFNLSPLGGIQIGDSRSKKLQLFFDLRFEYAILPTFNISKSGGQNYDTNMWTGTFGLGVRFN